MKIFGYQQTSGKEILLDVSANMVHLPDTLDDRENMDTSNSLNPWSLVIENMESELYDDPNLQDDMWKKFELESLPTPPSSPVYDLPLREIDSILSKTLNCNSLEDEVLSQAFTLFPSMDLDWDAQFQNSLIKDCMWSAPGLIAAGFLPGDCGTATTPTCSSSSSNTSSDCKINTNTSPNTKLDSSSAVDENSNNIYLSNACSSTKKLNLDINTKDCVDPASVFPCSSTSRSSSRNGSPDPSALSFHSYDLGMDTPSASSESDDEEIDVVTVAEKKQLAMGRPKRPFSLALNTKPTPPSHHIQQSTSGRVHNYPLSTTLPATTSVSAQVAAMHNYSSTTSLPKSSSRDFHHHHSKTHSYSAPQTPSNGHHHSSGSSSGHKRSRPYSSPNSPQYSKKQRLIGGESDLKAVARKLTGRRTHHSRVNNNTSSSNSSDMEDNSELGKRAYHNVLERKRRDDLRASFHHLRDNVPEICTNERAPKMVILNKAMDHIRELNRTHNLLSTEVQRQQQVQEQLKRKLNLLQRLN